MMRSILIQSHPSGNLEILMMVNQVVKNTWLVDKLRDEQIMTLNEWLLGDYND